MTGQQIRLSPREAATYATALVGDVAKAILNHDPAAAGAVITELAGVSKAAAVAASDAANDAAGSGWFGTYLAPGHQPADPTGYQTH